MPMPAITANTSRLTAPSPSTISSMNISAAPSQEPRASEAASPPSSASVPSQARPRCRTSFLIAPQKPSASTSTQPNIKECPADALARRKPARSRNTFMSQSMFQPSGTASYSGQRRTDSNMASSASTIATST
jgi:hypothetical protein